MKHCGNCMDYRPAMGASRFTCPECNAKYVLANVAPGGYWEPEDVAAAQQKAAQEEIDRFKSEKGCGRHGCKVAVPIGVAVNGPCTCKIPAPGTLIWEQKLRKEKHK